MTSNLKEDLNNYLARNEKLLIPATLKSTFTSISPADWFSKIKYKQVPTESNGSKDWADLSSDGCCPKLSKIQRLVGFCIFMSLGIFFFCIAMLLLPVLLLKARKFSILFTLGSLFMILSFSCLWGPVNHLKHLFSREKLIFTFTYFGTLFLTLYFALAEHNTPLTVLFAVLQIMALIWFLFSYIPGGYTGLSLISRFYSSAATNVVSKTLPV